MMKELEVLHNSSGVEYCVDRCVNFVLQSENVPADFPVRVFEHAGVQPAEHIRRVVLGIR